MVESLVQLVGVPVLALAVGVVIREIVLYRRMSPTLREWSIKTRVELPQVTDLRRLEGMAGERDGVLWRWDAEHRVLRFRRAFGRFGGFGRRGRSGQNLVSGSLGFDADGTPRLAFRPMPMWFFVAFTGLAVWGLIGVAVDEGSWDGVFAIPLAPVMFSPFGLIVYLGSRWTLVRSVLPVVADEIRARVG